MADPFKQKKLKDLEDEMQHLSNLKEKKTKTRRTIEQVFYNTNSPRHKDEYQNDLDNCQAELKEIEDKIEKAYQEKKSLENEYQEQNGEASLVNEEEQKPGDNSQFYVLIEESEKHKNLSDDLDVDEVSSTPETVQAKLLFQDNEPIENTVLYTATFFSQLSPYEFDRVVSFLLEEQPPITIKSKSQVITETSEVKIIETQEQKFLIEIWKNSINQPDKFLGKCYLKAVRLEDSSLVIDFSVPHLRKELKEYFEEQQPLYLENKFKQCQLLLFAQSVKIATSVIELTVTMAIYHPDIYREDWLLSIILEFTEEANWDINSSLEPEQKLHRILAEIKAERRREIVFARISFLIYKMLEHSQLKGVAENLIERLMSAQRYDAVLAIVKHLYSVPEFNGLYWVKQLLDRGNGEIRSDAYKFLYNRLKQSGSQIYNLLEAIKAWLPSSNRSPASYSRSNEYALQLLVEYCLETTSKLDQKYYGYWPSKYQLFALLQGTDASRKLEILVHWLFHPDHEGKLALKHIVDEGINPIQLIGRLIADWFTILWGLEKKEPTPEASELINKLLRQIILTISLPQQRELVQYWTELTEDLLSAAESQGESGDFKRKKLFILKRNLVRQLKKQFKSLQATNSIMK